MGGGEPIACGRCGVVFPRWSFGTWQTVKLGDEAPRQRPLCSSCWKSLKAWVNRPGFYEWDHGYKEG